MQRFIIICGLLILIAVAIPFAVYVWPTKYQYDRFRLDTFEVPVRIDRFTGQAEQLTVMGWQPLRPAEFDSLGRPVKMDLSGRPMVVGPPAAPDLFGNPITATPTPKR